MIAQLSLSQEQGSKSALSKAFNSPITKQMDGWNKVLGKHMPFVATDMNPPFSNKQRLKTSKIYLF